VQERVEAQVVQIPFKCVQNALETTRSKPVMVLVVLLVLVLLVPLTAPEFFPAATPEFIAPAPVFFGATPVFYLRKKPNEF
jgi:hypothetical protein